MAERRRGAAAGSGSLVAVGVRLERPFAFHADILGLTIVQLGQCSADLVEMQPGNLFVQVTRQNIDLGFILAVVLPKLDLCEYLVGETCAHHKAGVAGGVP